ncbi:MAG: hypothetical protein D6721_08525 [Gammaproteobacteria bacterium]|nr:MAG: hypothetical protein D6721_08525 [Gammaproteobacteria bacterium]
MLVLDMKTGETLLPETRRAGTRNPASLPPDRPAVQAALQPVTPARPRPEGPFAAVLYARRELLIRRY